MVCRRRFCWIDRLCLFCSLPRKNIHGARQQDVAIAKNFEVPQRPDDGEISWIRSGSNLGLQAACASYHEFVMMKLVAMRWSISALRGSDVSQL